MPMGAMGNGMQQLIGGSTGMPQMSNFGNPVPQYGNMTPNSAMSMGGAQNLPNMYGGGNQGFQGVNASMANQNPSWMNGMMTGGQSGQNMYGAPVYQGAGQNPYTNFNLSTMSPNQALGQQSSQMGYLQDIASGQGAGQAVNQTPAWNAMVGAQQYNIQQGADSLAEQFNNGGGLFSTAYGNAAGQYQQQATLGQNAQLTAATTAAQQQAMQNQMGAAGQLSSQGYGALGQLSNQGYNAASQMSSQQYGAAQQAAGYQYGAASQNSSQGATAGLAGINQQLQLQQMGLTGGYQQGMLGQSNLQTGNTLGNSQLTANQNQLTGAYQNWYNSQPQNSPLLSMMYSGATGYPQMTQSTYNPGSLGSLLGGLGGLAGGLTANGGSSSQSLLQLLGLSDRRLKENIVRVGKVKDISLYNYNFPGGPTQLGVMAQQVVKKHPEAVIKGDDKTPWLVDYGKLALAMGVK